MTKSWLRKLHRWRARRSRGKPRRVNHPIRAKAKPRPMRPKGKTPSRQPWPIPRRYVAIAMILIALAAFIYSYYRFDRMILPLVLEAAEMRLQTEINNVINQVVQEIISERDITAADFIVQHTLVSESGPVVSVNTVLVNEISNAVAMQISQRLDNMEPETVAIPMGMAFNLDTLAQVGPRYTFRLAPIGNALVDYGSRFTAVGINQTRLSVWLTVESEVRIINPVQSSVVEVTRHVSLVDTIISGIVPDAYLNMDPPTAWSRP